MLTLVLVMSCIFFPLYGLRRLAEPYVLYNGRKVKQNSRMFSTSITGDSEDFSIQDENFMRLALRHAQHAFRENEVPIGAVLIDNNGEIISASRNTVESSQDATAHAEINCLRKAASLLGNWRLLDTTLYSTLEPCPMCLSAIQSFRVKRVVYGACDLRLGACGTHINLLTKPMHPFHAVDVSGGLLQEDSARMLKRFFANRRIENSDKEPFLDRGDTDMPFD